MLPRLATWSLNARAPAPGFASRLHTRHPLGSRAAPGPRHARHPSERGYRPPKPHPESTCPPVTMYTGIQIALPGTWKMALFCLTFGPAKPREYRRSAPPVDLATCIPINTHPCCPVFSRITDAAAYRYPGIPAPLGLSPSGHDRILHHTTGCINMVPVIPAPRFPWLPVSMCPWFTRRSSTPPRVSLLTCLQVYLFLCVTFT